MFLEKVEFNKKEIPLLSNKTGSDENQYSIVVGKNGIGKSRLLNKIISTVSCEENIVAITTSPFDKFPINKGSINYNYVGPRSTSAKTISSTIASILTTNHSNIEAFSKTIKALSLLPEIKLMTVSGEEFLKAGITTKVIEEAFCDNGKGYIKRKIKKELESVITKSRGVNRVESSLALRIHSSVLSEAGDLYRFLDENRSYIFKERLISIEGDKSYDFSELKELKRHKVININDIILFNDDGTSFKASEASSGQQCTIMIILGIASKIKDNSLILIDEPEISLHPHWQKQFIPLLKSCFNNYKNCHFVIATHSPLIISELKSDNCHIVDMNRGGSYSASKFANKSSDFQLAELFGEPGDNNEYLKRLVIELMSSFSRNSGLSKEENNEYMHLKKMAKGLDKDDTVKHFINVLDTAIERVNKYD